LKQVLAVDKYARLGLFLYSYNIIISGEGYVSSINTDEFMSISFLYTN